MFNLKRAAIVVLTLGLAFPARAGVTINPVIGNAFVSRDGETESVQEVLADLSYTFPWGKFEPSRWRGEISVQYGYGENGNQVADFGCRTMLRVDPASPGFGLHVLKVEDAISEAIDEDSVAFGPEVFLEVPWKTFMWDTKDGCVLAYGAVYFPVSGDDDFSVVRLGVRTRI